MCGRAEFKAVMSGLQSSGQLAWLTRVCDPLRAETRGSISIGKYGNRELRKKFECRLALIK